MDLRRWIAVVIAAGSLLAMAGPAGAHGGPIPCVLLASLADVNNTEYYDPGPLNPMAPAPAGAQYAHPNNQKRGTGNRYGLYYPVTDPVQAHWTQTGSAPNHGAGIPPFKGDHFRWRQIDTCEGTGTPYSASGTGLGYCGRSVGLGSTTVAGHAGIVKWESFGTQLVLVDPTAVGSVNAQANPPGSPNGSCLDGGAAQFTVDGVVVHL